ncbi:YdeI/OmpD-associated family protein [Paenibacillus dokdonensis]|uniref:YdeI/OmpD-associated family protein n=1 Tax=Paenibacillus dokdonensis TaxID=2567944 RepID=A0ABU6GVC8_9BACL|nr:YdeI/OmpD-associated family protein [Paenibacillus dokdonensis]MEC0243709.1 YdeI/OmpD-associated family protein [Paenibacillus dokdonensis]
MKKPEGQAEWPLLLCESQSDWEAWLEQNHHLSKGVRLQIAKKNSGFDSVSYDEALDSAICYGWIDSRKEKLDEKSWIQRFGPRGKDSIWSQVNREKVRRLTEEGRMKPAGLQAVETARNNGRWEAAYESQSRSTLPEELEAAFAEHPDAKAFYETLNSQNKFAITFRIKNAKKPETRKRKVDEFIRMLENGEKIYP